MASKSPLKTPLFVALDVDTKEEALNMAKEIQPYVGGFKIGPRLSVKYGADFISHLAELGPVFVDNKFYDIPTTMISAIRATFDAGASYTTIHVAAGKQAIREIVELEKELNQKRPFKVLGVTVLTSFSQDDLPPHWKKSEIKTQVDELADFAVECGLTGLVCSAHEVEELRNRHKSVFLVTPGVRFSNESQGDQKRVMDPKHAIDAGSSALVVGRPICKAKDPVAAAKSYFAVLKD